MKSCPLLEAEFDGDVIVEHKYYAGEISRTDFIVPYSPPPEDRTYWQAASPSRNIYAASDKRAEGF